jgi:hypothetical protein
MNSPLIKGIITTEVITIIISEWDTRINLFQSQVILTTIGLGF